ncbi:MAG: A/G-specific adenine glycosylase [Halioglobus sp.]|nr:A/G-specific adenine glycosylase [Halioglobus sp.]
MLAPFSTRVLAWFDQHGRKDLPWQQNTSPYRIWVSEIMLQQTQVNTVIPYFERFMARFPDVQALADAPEDEVLHLWTGLGYYARARNLHKAAREVTKMHGGQLPDTIEALCDLPGIGRSTAGAIASIAFGQRASILDGNVKRVLARYHRVAGWPGRASVDHQLWKMAERYTPDERCADYTQAIMDLGATHCTRRAPACDNCPLRDDCAGRLQGDQLRFPGKKPQKVLPVKSTCFLVARNREGQVWLEKRPTQGIWGGLWCFPEISSPAQGRLRSLDLWHTEPVREEVQDGFRHSFSHYHLDITPVVIDLDTSTPPVMETPGRLWYNLRKPPQIGLAAPVATLLKQLAGAGTVME